MQIPGNSATEFGSSRFPVQLITVDHSSIMKGAGVVFAATTSCEDGGAAPVAPAGRSSSSLGAVLKIKGVGSVMVSLVLLALLLGARTWIDLDAVSIRTMHTFFVALYFFLKLQLKSITC